jgi:hypothetical protein
MDSRRFRGARDRGCPTEAERSGDNLVAAIARMTLGLALVHRATAAERDRGQKLLAQVSEVLLRRGHNLCDLPIVNMYLARERAKRGDRDDAILAMRTCQHLVAPLTLDETQ